MVVKLLFLCHIDDSFMRPQAVTAVFMTNVVYLLLRQQSSVWALVSAGSKGTWEPIKIEEGSWEPINFKTNFKRIGDKEPVKSQIQNAQ